MCIDRRRGKKRERRREDGTGIIYESAHTEDGVRERGIRIGGEDSDADLGGIFECEWVWDLGEDQCDGGRSDAVGGFHDRGVGSGGRGVVYSAGIGGGGECDDGDTAGAYGIDGGGESGGKGFDAGAVASDGGAW
jgi:hypothetical protein